MGAGRRTRLDRELVRRGLARSREESGELIKAGRVTVNGMVAAKPATAVAPETPVAVRRTDEVRWASRGAHKLLGALDAFASLSVADRRCLDAGASTGGFTDVLLRKGAGQVICVDVGYGQLDWRLRSDPRVIVRDRTNVRHMTATDLSDVGGPVDLVVADLSFISLRTVLPALLSLVQPDGDVLVMVKPQFEVGPDRVGKGGVVSDDGIRGSAVTDVCTTASDLGWGTRGLAPSPLPGPSGNREFFAWLRAGGGAPPPEQVQRVVAAGDPWLSEGGP